MRVSELAKTLNITPDTVRFYTRNQVLKPIKSKENGYKEYGDKDISRLRFVLNARQLGFSVEDIKVILAESDKAISPCDTVKRLIEKRLHETEQRFLEVQRLRDRMQQAIKEWETLPSKAPGKHNICHLIEDFEISPELLGTK
jgi:DNA-binding transcriptional MerR regulator